MNVKIRKAKFEDLDDIYKLECQYKFEKYSYNELSKSFGLKFYHYYVAIYDNFIVGYLVATFIFDECEVLKIIVDEKYKNREIGKKIFNRLISDCIKSKIHNIILEVRIDNTIAIQFYEKIGFQFERLRKLYYNGVDAKIYRLIINDKESSV